MSSPYTKSFTKFRDPDVGITCEDCLGVSYYYSTEEAEADGWVDSPLGWLCKECNAARVQRGQVQ